MWAAREERKARARATPRCDSVRTLGGRLAAAPNGEPAGPNAGGPWTQDLALALLLRKAALFPRNVLFRRWRVAAKARRARRAVATRLGRLAEPRYRKAVWAEFAMRHGRSAVAHWAAGAADGKKSERKLRRLAAACAERHRLHAKRPPWVPSPLLVASLAVLGPALSVAAAAAAGYERLAVLAAAALPIGAPAATTTLGRGHCAA